VRWRNATVITLSGGHWKILRSLNVPPFLSGCSHLMNAIYLILYQGKLMSINFCNLVPIQFQIIGAVVRISPNHPPNPHASDSPDSGFPLVIYSCDLRLPRLSRSSEVIKLGPPTQ